jgi:WD40 repeat protein
VKIWDWKRGGVVTTIATAAGSLAFDPTGTRIVTSHPYDGSAAIWDVKSGQKVATIAGNEGSILDVTFRSDGSAIATSARDGTVRLWNARSGVQTLQLRASQSEIRSVAFSPDGSKLASGGADGVVRVWALDRNDLIGIAKRGLTRRLTEEECLQYLHVQRCPPAPGH